MGIYTVQKILPPPSPEALWDAPPAARKEKRSSEGTQKNSKIAKIPKFAPSEASKFGRVFGGYSFPLQGVY